MWHNFIKLNSLLGVLKSTKVQYEKRIYETEKERNTIKRKQKIKETIISNGAPKN